MGLWRGDKCDCVDRNLEESDAVVDVEMLRIMQETREVGDVMGR